MKKQIKTCKFCGQSGFLWTRTVTGWRLLDPTSGGLHQCSGATPTGATRTQLLQKAIDMGLDPTMADKMRLRDLESWIAEQQGTTPVDGQPEPDNPGEPEQTEPEAPEAPHVDPEPEHTPDGAAVHPNFHKVVRYFKAAPGVHQWWAGPAGSGKTTLAEQVAAHFGLEFVLINVSRNMDEFQLFGYMDGHGRYVPGKLYEALKGTNKLVLIDECDRGTDGVLVALNSILAQRRVTFPNGESYTIDPSVLFVASGNTWGRGADAQYAAAGALDAAFLDRFGIKLAHDYDEPFELQITADKRWTRFVQKVRRAAFDLRLPVVISPRLSIAGGLLLKSGVSWQSVEQDVLWPNVSEELRPAIQSKLQSMGVAA